MKILISEAEIREKVAELGGRITADYTERPLTVLGVLNGSLVFLADLIRRVAVPHQVGLVQASSYRGATTRPGSLTINTDFLPPIGGRDVLLLDDIFDTGQTLAALLERLTQLEPRSLRSAVLLWKQGRQTVEVRPDYHCFTIPDLFVVGYGLDYNDNYRHLPHVAALESEER